MPIGSLFRVLAASALLLLLTPAWGAGEEPPLPPTPPSAPSTAETAGEQAPSAIAMARALVNAGRFAEALVILGPILREEEIDPDTLFLFGLAATGASHQPGLEEEDREALLEGAIAAFHEMLIDQPGLVRVHLELGRAFFLKGEDDLARRHFEWVLAGNPPQPVVANVGNFLAAIQARRRWSFNVGAALAPDSNIGAGSEERTIYVPVFGQLLPFERNAEELTTSGIGVAVWGGAEYQVPLAERWRLRAGGEASRREYSGSEFDRLSLASHLGPRWLADANTEASLLASARQSWTGTAPDNRALGARLEVGHRVTPRVTAFAQASWHDRRHRNRPWLDGPIMDASLRGSWVVTPTVRANLSAGYARERSERARERNRSRWLGAGVEVTSAAGLHRRRQRPSALDRLRGRVDPEHAAGRGAGGPDAEPQPLAPQPGAHGLRLQPRARGGERGAGDQRAALRLPAHPRRAEVRKVVLGFLFSLSFPSDAGRRVNLFPQSPGARSGPLGGPVPVMGDSSLVAGRAVRDGALDHGAVHGAGRARQDCAMKSGRAKSAADAPGGRSDSRRRARGTVGVRDIPLVPLIPLDLGESHSILLVCVPPGPRAPGRIGRMRAGYRPCGPAGARPLSPAASEV